MDDLVYMDTETTPDPEDTLHEGSDGYGEFFDFKELSVYSVLHDAGTSLPGTVNPPKRILPKQPDFSKLRPYFGWLPAERIKATIKCTTQWFRAEDKIDMRRHFKSRFPAANVSRLNEIVATDTFFSEVEALDDGIPGYGGCTMVQLLSLIHI